MSNLLKKLYLWVIHWAKTPYAVFALFILAVAESSFFIIPPDTLLIAMGLGKPKKSFFYALVCSVGSVLGGIVGYTIGYFLWAKVQGFFIPHIFSQSVFDAVQAKYALHSFWIVFTAAFTPIPYKVFTITAGVCGISLLGFFVASSVGRSMRFFLVATVLFFFGERAEKYIEKLFTSLCFLSYAVAWLITVQTGLNYGRHPLFNRSRPMLFLLYI